MNFHFMWAEENYNYYDLASILFTYGLRSKKRFGCGINNGLTFGKGSHAEFYLPEEELKKEAKCWFNFLMKPNKIKFLLDEIKISEKDAIERIRALVLENLNKMSNHDLWDFYDFFGFKYGRLMSCYITTQPHRVVNLEEDLKTFLVSRRVSNVPKYISMLTEPKNKFIFLPAGNMLFKRSLVEMLSNENAKIDRTLINKKAYRKVRSNLKNKRKIIKELNPPRKILHIINVLSTLAEERFRMRFVWMLMLYYSELFLIEIKRRFKVSKKDIRYYDADEMENLIKSGKKVSKRDLKIRKYGFLKLLQNGKIREFVGKRAERVFLKLTKIENKDYNIEGSVASPGHVVGKVVILSYRDSKNHARKIRNMKKGDIIVSEMTRPNIINACENAGAIITDEGGTLSHAAIVSREMGIPCIIGTKISTRILKDGDFVEVDAIDGVVKKITKKDFEAKRRVSNIKTTIKGVKLVKEKMNKLKSGNIFWFKDIGHLDLPSVGGKGANLGELFKFVNVPNGFCISVTCYQDFIKQNKISMEIKKILNRVDIKNSIDIENKSNKIRKLILSKKISEKVLAEIKKSYEKLGTQKVAVRSSATAEDLPEASFAGQQDTYLNISNFDSLVKSIKKCWASLFNSRAIYYREKNKFIHENVLVSVVVQKMVNPKYAGVMFTKDPIKKDNLVIEAVVGLGEKLVGGEVVPNNYLIDRKNFEIIQKKEKFKVEYKIIKKIAEAGIKIEKHFESPQDIEWAIDKNNKMFILQTRPITA